MNESYILFSKTGRIKIITGSTQKTITSNVFAPLISTRINVKNINFEEENILPGEDGKLYLINSQTDQYDLLNLNFESLISTSPYRISYFPKGVFTGYQTHEDFLLDTDNASIKAVNQTFSPAFDHKHIFISRNDFFLQMTYNKSLVAWNASVSALTLNNSTESVKDLSPIDTKIMDENKDEYIFFFKMTYHNNHCHFLRFNSEQLTKNDEKAAQNPAKTYKINNFMFKLYLNSLIIASTALFTLGVLFRHYKNVHNNKNKEESLIIISKDNTNNNNLTSSTTVCQKAQEPQAIEDKLSLLDLTEDISQLSTISFLNNKSFECEVPMKTSHSFSIPMKYAFYHKESAPEINNEWGKRRKNVEEYFSGEEELSPNKVYTMEAITEPSTNYTNQNTFPIFPKEKFYRKLSDSTCSKKKYKPSDQEVNLLKLLSHNYLNDKKISSSDSLFKLEHCASKNDKYFQIYKIIKQNDIDDSSSNSEVEKEEEENLFFNSKNYTLCDTGRFVSNFENIQLIDKGGFGTVFKAMHKIDGSYYAIKIIKFQLGIEDDLSKIKEVQEIKTMMKVEHKNIVRYITCWFEFEDKNLYNKRARALSMDEKGKSKKSFERMNLKDRSKSNLGTKTEFELVVNEDNSSFSDKKEKDFFFNENDSDCDRNKMYNDEDYSFEDDKLVKFKNEESNSRSYDHIIFGNDSSNSHSEESHGGHIIFGNSSKSKSSSKNNSTNSVQIKNLKNSKQTCPLYFYMQMEYCEGCPLSYYLKNRKCPSDEKLIIFMFLQMSKGLRHIHLKNIIHRDLKPANIFINGNYKIKIGDFGLATESTEKTAKDKVGTFLYQSPEQVEGKIYNEKVDIYALGLILLEMCLFFGTESERQTVLLGVRKGIYPDEISEYQEEFKLIKKMTHYQSELRPTIEEVIESDEVNEMIGKLNQ